MSPMVGLRQSLTTHALILSTVFSVIKYGVGSTFDYLDVFHNFWTDCTVSSVLTYRIYHRRMHHLHSLMPTSLLIRPFSGMTPMELRMKCRKYMLFLNTGFLLTEIAIQTMRWRLITGAAMLEDSM